MLATRGSLTLDPEVIVRARARAQSLLLPVATYIAILIRNDVLLHTAEPALAEVQNGAKRVDLPLSLAAAVRRQGTKRANELDLYFSRYVEILLRADLRAPGRPLLVQPET